MLSLDQAVQIALQANPGLTEAQAAVRRAEAVVAEARSFQLPRLDGDAQFTLQGPIPEFTITTPSPTPGAPPVERTIPFGRTFTKNFSITGTFDPDPFGRLRANTRAARRQVNVSRGTLYTTRNELVFAVQNVYLAALRSQELINVAREAVEAAREQLRVAEAQLRAGTAPEFDVLRARVQVQNLLQNQVTAEANFRRTASMLSRILSLNPQQRLELVPVALPPESDALVEATAMQAIETPPALAAPGAAPGAPIPTALETALGEAFSSRPEIYRSEWARRAAEARVQFERRGRYPSLGLTAGFQYNPDQTGLAVQTKTWSIIANVTVPIWDAGLAQARTRQARADVAAAAAQLTAARDTVAEEVKIALEDLRDAAERRRSASANVTEAREALRIARVRYTAGLAPNVEVTDAEAALTQARSNEVNAAYDLLAALANLNRSLGRYVGEVVNPPADGRTPTAAPAADTGSQSR
jgi:outer membrane protein TolC